ncbi:conserved Plasmodium protein, unknown function [Plasmodium gaboni]|uniref:Serpentine receptor n=1 Tax=Plasmodium gaboni TaxID=647221 RepID=A0ABY1UPI6_9APIC|nr:conserved Plasmodium protein, unknown function [Plasmodium gaboni]
MIKIIAFLYSFLIFYLFESWSYKGNVEGKEVKVIYTNDSNKNKKKNELNNFQYIFLNENEENYDISSSALNEINIEEEDIYFYKSFTKIINYFKYRIPANINFTFEYNHGDIILLDKKKKGVTCKINNLFYSESGLKYLDRKNELYVKSEPFVIKHGSKENNTKNQSITNNKNNINSNNNSNNNNYNNYNNYNNIYNIPFNSSMTEDEIMNGAALCENTNKNFIPKKMLCFPSSNKNNELNITFIKNEEYKQLMDLYMTGIKKDNTYILKKIANYFKSILNLDYDLKNISYYIFSKTLQCNLQNIFSLPYENEEEYKMQNIIWSYNNEQIAINNSFIYSNILGDEKIGNRNIIWRHENNNILKYNMPKCNSIFFNEQEYFNCYKNLQYVYEILLYQENNVLNKYITNKSIIKNISSVNQYTAIFYDDNDYVILLKDYKYYISFQLKNIIDLVLFQDSINDISFYYINFESDNMLLRIYKCSLNNNDIKCNDISFIPYEINSKDKYIYLSTNQKKDISAVFVSTNTKVWKIYRTQQDGDNINNIDNIKNIDNNNNNSNNSNNLYSRKLIDSIKNTNEEYFGHINCYGIEATYERKFLSKYLNNIPDENENENVVGCSYFKYYNNTSNTLLISFIENKHFIQRTFHVVKNKNIIVSSGTTKLIIRVNEVFDMIIMFIIFLVLLLSVYLIYKLLFTKKMKVRRMKHYFFDDAKNSCPSTVGH